MMRSLSPFLIIAANACITAIMMAMHGGIAVGIIILAVWLLAPHLILLAMLAGLRREENRRASAIRYLAILASFIGIVFLASFGFGPLDAQKAILLFYTPAVQAAVWLAGLVPVVCVPRK